MEERKRPKWNIGTVVLIALLAYLVIMIVVYLMTDHVSSYMVTFGTLSGNDSYTAMAVRQEEIVKAPADGYVTYYAMESSKASRNDVICTVAGNKSELTTIRLSDSDLSAVRDLVSRFSRSYSPNSFNNVYELKFAVNSSIVNNSDTGKVNGMVSEAPSDGIVSFITDGKEERKAENISADDFANTEEPARSLQTFDKVSAGDPLYKIISGEHWSLIFPLTESQYASLSSRKTVKVRFVKDGNTETGDLNLFDRDGRHFAEVTLYSGMVRYCTDRYLEIELVTNTYTG
ncbi:MAG: hypothetical protein HUJ73_08245, partial [Eubacterium sp.]|nr:hypothetical protein [Eubacterium sp.]